MSESEKDRLARAAQVHRARPYAAVGDSRPMECRHRASQRCEESHGFPRLDILPFAQQEGQSAAMHSLEDWHR